MFKTGASWLGQLNFLYDTKDSFEIFESMIKTGLPWLEMPIYIGNYL